jgi:hypothetical protein
MCKNVFGGEDSAAVGTRGSSESTILFMGSGLSHLDHHLALNILALDTPVITNFGMVGCIH